MSNRYRWIPSLRVRQTAARVAVVLGMVASLASCTSVQRDGQGTSYLIVDSLLAASGATPAEFGGTLASDVITLVPAGQDADGNELFAPTIFADPGQVTFRLAPKDPSVRLMPANFITVTRYRVDFIRSDGRNTPGIDVPYGFDGAFTATVTDTGGAGTFELVRIQAKLEAPLKALAYGGGAISISTLAEITFYGQDQAGREVSVTGRIGVNFADWGDPD